MDLQSDLIALGLTEYESRVYLSLLEGSPANGYQVSKRTGVPRSMVYEALGRLHARGAILKAGNDRSTLYRPVPPDQLLDRYEEEYQRLLGNLRVRLQAVYSSPHGELLGTIAGENSILSQASRMIQEASEELLLVLNDRVLERLREWIVSACARGLPTGVLLTGMGDLACENVARHPPLESELQGLGNLLVVVSDGKECLIASTGENMSGTITNNQNMVFITRQFIWMELFTQRLYRRLNPELMDLLDQEERRILQSLRG